MPAFGGEGRQTSYSPPYQWPFVYRSPGSVRPAAPRENPGIAQGDVVVNRGDKRTEVVPERRIGQGVVDILKLRGEFCLQGFIAFHAVQKRVDGVVELGVAEQCVVDVDSFR